MDRIGRLRRRGEQGLTELLRARPDVLVGRAPRTVAELADRLDSPRSVSAAIDRLDAPHLQVLVAVAGLGGAVSLYRLAELLDGDPRPQLRKLAELDLLQVDDDVAHMSPTARRSVPDLLGLGHPLAEIAAVVNHEALQVAERALGLEPSGTKAGSTAALQQFYDDPDRVRGHAVDRLPAPAIADLVAFAAGDARDDEDPQSWQREALIEQLGVRTGLIIDDSGGWQPAAFMPSEVGLALRGPGFRIRFDPAPPVVVWLPISRTASDSAAALAAFDSAATAVLDQVAARPLTPLQAGGVGRREMQRVAKSTRVDVGTVLLVLELADEAGLLLPLGRVQVTDTFRAWRDAEPAERVVALASAWWRFPGRPGDERDDDGSARAAFTAARCNGCLPARQTVVGVLGTGTGLAVADIGELAGWRSPTSHIDEHLALHLREAELLGVVAQGAATPFGAALVAGDDTALHEAARAALPPTTVHATFGSDLTVFVAGSPSATVSTLLDSCAVRESGGGAVTWRLSAASVRAALDEGRSVDALRESLREIAAAGTLPGAVETLLDDVARVYGRAVVQRAGAVVVSEDQASLVEMVHDRRLGKLGLQLVAPTVLVAAVPPHALATGLRAAGYMPAWTDEFAAAREPAAPIAHPLRRIEAAHARGLPDPAELARRLLAAGTAPPATSATEKAIRQQNRALSGDEVAVLAHAVETRDRVQIVYESSTGGITERVIRPSGLVGDRIWAWCELRSDDREFVLERVLGVRGV